MLHGLLVPFLRFKFLVSSAGRDVGRSCSCDVKCLGCESGRLAFVGVIQENECWKRQCCRKEG
jgi:hypothetical protein